MGILYTLRAMVKEKEVPTEPPRFYIRACYNGLADDGFCHWVGTMLSTIR